MSEETSIANTEVPAASGNSKADDASLENLSNSEVKTQENQEFNDDGTPKDPAKAEEKPEKTEAERERARMQRGIDRKTRQAAEARAQLQIEREQRQALERKLEQLTNPQTGVDYQSESGDSDKLTLTRAEAARLIEEEARKLAPTIAKQAATEEQLRSAAIALKQELGDEFDELTEELEDVLPREKQLALLSSKNAAALVRYLADADNSTEAKRIAGMSDFQAGMAIAALEVKLASKKAEEKPTPSNAPKPLELVRGQGTAQKDPSRMTDREFAEWRRSQIRARR